MNVSELIQKLKTLDPDLPVYVEDGLDPSDPQEVTRIVIEVDRFNHQKEVVCIR